MISAQLIFEIMEKNLSIRIELRFWHCSFIVRTALLPPSGQKKLAVKFDSYEIVYRISNELRYKMTVLRQTVRMLKRFYFWIID